MKYSDILGRGEKFDISGISFEAPILDMLVIDDENYDEHLSKHAAGVAYFGTQYKMAIRDYDNVKQAWDRRFAEMYAYCLAMMTKTGGKPVIKEVEAMVFSKYGEEINKWQERLGTKKEELDCIEQFYEAWKQNSFTISNYTSLVEAGLRHPKSVNQENIKALEVKSGVLSLIKKHQEK